MNKDKADIPTDNLDMGTHLKERLKKNAQTQELNQKASAQAPKEASQAQVQKPAKPAEPAEDVAKVPLDESQTKQQTQEDHLKHLEASFSTLILSLSSAALMALGLAMDPSTKAQPKKDKMMAKFNIDMLIMLKEKTKGNLTQDEQKILDAFISDLQLKYIEN